MSERRIESVLYKGIVNRSLTVAYVYFLRLEGKYKMIEEDNNGNIHIYPSYLIQLNPGFPNPRFFISPRQYFSFIAMFDKSVKLIQENLFELFPNVSKSEFEIDERALNRFQTEKALCTANLIMMPSVYVDSTNQCYPGLNISSTDKSGSITIPLEDAIAINQLFKTFDPNTFGMNVLSQLIKIE